MSTDDSLKAAALKAEAFHIFSQLVVFVGPNYWDWQKLADQSFDAVENFELVASKRIVPQTSTQADPTQAPAVAASSGSSAQSQSQSDSTPGSPDPSVSSPPHEDPTQPWHPRYPGMAGTQP